MQYSGKDSGRATIFEITVGQIDRGENLSWLSQYPKEEEVCSVHRTVHLRFCAASASTRTCVRVSGFGFSVESLGSGLVVAVAWPGVRLALPRPSHNQRGQAGLCAADGAGQVLMPPLSNLEVIGPPRIETSRFGPVMVIPLRVNVNIKSRCGSLPRQCAGITHCHVTCLMSRDLPAVVWCDLSVTCLLWGDVTCP